MKKEAQKKRSAKKSGFTLVETMVSLAIFSVSILAVVALLGDNITSVGYAEKKMTASYLAEEGIELVRDLRDSFVLYDPGGAQSGWNAFLTKMGPCDSTSNAGKKCYIDNRDFFSKTNVTSVQTPACGGGACPAFYENSDGYNYDTIGAPTDFVRDIGVVRTTADELRVFSTVHWRQKSQSYSVTFSESLFNWVE